MKIEATQENINALMAKTKMVIAMADAALATPTQSQSFSQKPDDEPASLVDISAKVSMGIADIQIKNPALSFMDAQKLLFIRNPKLAREYVEGNPG